MKARLRLKKSSVKGHTPIADESQSNGIKHGELAINFNNEEPSLFFKDSANTIRSINLHDATSTRSGQLSSTDKVKYDNHVANTNNPHNVTKAQIELGNVDNTSDINKPISAATQTALNSKVDKETGKGLSTNDFTTAEKQKLAGIAVGANNYTHPSYPSATSGLYKITIDGLGHVSSVTAVTKADITGLGIPGQDTNTTYSDATQSTSGLMSAGDKAKLDGIQAGAQVNPSSLPANDVYSWAKQPNKPSYSWNEIGDKPTIPTATSQLTNDSGFLTSHQSLDGYWKAGAAIQNAGSSVELPYGYNEYTWWITGSGTTAISRSGGGPDSLTNAGEINIIKIGEQTYSRTVSAQ